MKDDYVVRCGEREGEGWIGYLADKVLLSMPPRGKGIYLDVEGVSKILG